MLGNASSIPLNIERALMARGFFKLETPLGTGVLYSNGGVISTITPASGSYYVATISGGAVNHFIQISNGVLTTA